MVKSLYSGTTLAKSVTIYASCFPETYALIVETLIDAMATKAAKEPSWLPPSWMDAAIRTFMRIPFGAQVSLSGGAETPKGDFKLKVGGLMTGAQITGQPANPLSRQQR